MERGVMDPEERCLENEAAQINISGRINMPASFESMQEMVTTLDDAIPNNPFLRKWPKARVNKDDANAGGGRNRFRPKGGRGGFRG